MATIENEESLKQSIKNLEEVFIDSKKSMENIFKNRNDFPPNEEWVSELKEFYRWVKTETEHQLKHLKEEITLIRQGLNIPYFYKYMEKHKH